jgi:hypothetical protein
MSVADRNFRGVYFAPLAALGLASACLGTAGCDRRQSAAERLEQAYESSGLKRVAVYPLAGKVSLDREAPALEPASAILIVAYDASIPEAPAKRNAFVEIKRDGSFEFPGGGLPPGKYVMLFAALEGNLKRGYQGPDRLKNLYNDPDVNANRPEFVIEHQAPGKTDYAFNLPLAGETPRADVGAKAFVGFDARIHLPANK